MKKLILFPFNGNTKEASSIIKDINAISPEWDLLGFIDDDPTKKGATFGKHKVLGNRNVLDILKDIYVLAVPGRPENFLNRAQIIQSLNIDSDRYATIIHPSVQIGVECSIGKNNLLMANVVLTANVSIKSHVVILPSTVISHDSVINEWCLIGSNVSISGGVEVGDNCYVGTGSKLISDIKIGKKSIIGIGSVVISNIPAHSTYAGNPAKDLYET